MIQLQAGLQVGPLPPHGPGARFRSPSSSGVRTPRRPSARAGWGCGPGPCLPCPVIGGGSRDAHCPPIFRRGGTGASRGVGHRAEGRGPTWRGSQPGSVHTNELGGTRPRPPPDPRGGRGPTC